MVIGAAPPGAPASGPAVADDGEAVDGAVALDGLVVEGGGAVVVPIPPAPVAAEGAPGVCGAPDPADPAGPLDPGPCACALNATTNAAAEPINKAFLTTISPLAASETRPNEAEGRQFLRRRRRWRS